MLSNDNIFQSIREIYSYYDFFLFLLSNYITDLLKELCSTFIIVKNFECTGAIMWYGIWLILKNMSCV